jgi:mannose-6-phosphate isomerase
MAGIYRLKGTVKNYDWGGYSFIPSLLQVDNSTNQPFAEYWMGTHPLGMGVAEQANGETTTLNELTGDLPYLLKAQDVKEMLSIQVHPSKESAKKEFARENEEGIPADAPNRNYKDENHKPEMAVAYSDFWLLHGFKPQEELVYTLLNVVELRELLPVFNEGGYAGLYKHVMEMPQEEVNRILRPLVDNLSVLYKDEQPEKGDEDFWAARAARTFTRNGNIDRGIFSIYLFNLVHLKKGEAIFQDAGVPHAYLEGLNIEIMANSDNVLRGGLTTKHIDVKELLKHVKAEATYPRIIEGKKLNDHELLYDNPATEFDISWIELEAGQTLHHKSVTTEILLLTEGNAVVTAGENSIEMKHGQPSALVLPGTACTITAKEGKVTIYRAFAPVHNG